MTIRFPNRTGEIGTYVDGVVTLSDQSLPGMRSFAAALAAERIEDGDTLGLSIRAMSDAGKWIVCQASYDAAGFVTITVPEDSAGGAIIADTLVEVTACVTDGMLRGFDYTATDYPDAPPAWVPQDDPPYIAWDAFSGYWYLYESSQGWLTPGAGVAALRPSTWSVDVWVPLGADLSEAASSAGFVLLFEGGFLQVYAGAGVTEGWNTVFGTVENQTGDITAIGLFAGYADQAGYRYRNLVGS